MGIRLLLSFNLENLLAFSLDSCLEVLMRFERFSFCAYFIYSNKLFLVHEHTDTHTQRHTVKVENFGFPSVFILGKRNTF